MLKVFHENAIGQSQTTNECMLCECWTYVRSHTYKVMLQYDVTIVVFVVVVAGASMKKDMQHILYAIYVCMV